jgi:hypothetical protein
MAVFRYVFEATPRLNADHQAWLVLGGAFAGAVCAYGMVAAWGAWQSYYASNLLKNYPK